MAFGCRYQLTLVIMHFDVCVEELTKQLSSIPIQRCVQRGTVNERTKRAASVSHWTGLLTEKEWEDSEVLPIAEALRACLPNLQQYSTRFAELAEEGSVYIDVVMFTDTLHSVVVLPPSILQPLADANLEITWQWYAEQKTKPWLENAAES